jgi:polysaccharide pyruvyl transferase CsaB
MTQTKIVISGYYGKGNAGDEALLLSLLQMLPSQFKPLVLSGNPQQTSDRYQVTSYYNRSIPEILKALSQAEYFIWGGGSLMQDVTSLASPIYYAGLMALAQQQGLKTIAWAQGIGPLNSPLTRWITKTVLKRCVAVSVRDEASALLLQQWGLNPLIAPDPVWVLEGKPDPELKNIPSPRIAVVLREHPQLTDERLTNLTQALINFQKATQSQILFIPFQETKDLAIARNLTQQIPQSHLIKLEDPKTIKGLFQEIEMVIGMRYHSLIMAAAEGCRCFAISYDPKVSQLMKQINIPGWTLDQIPNHPDLISQNWLECYHQSQPLTIVERQNLIQQASQHKNLLIT